MYSQYGEEEHILKAVAGCPADLCRFLDLGAFHPTTFSNTRALVDRGWSGVFVDVSPSAIMDLTREYGSAPERFTVVQCAVSVSSRQFVDIHATTDAVSTSDAATYEKWKNAVGYYGKYLAPAVPASEIAIRFGGKFGFINVDVEGVSVGILGSLLSHGLRPRCFCVEFDDERGRVLSLAASNGYSVVYENGTNMVLARS